jgi:xanthine phosphoribosyltransferase
MGFARQRHVSLLPCALFLALQYSFIADAWVSSPRNTYGYCPASLQAKRNRKQNDDDLIDWYGSVDANATPDDVFWEEMERQRLLSRVGGTGESEESESAKVSSNSAITTTATTVASSMNPPSQPNSMQPQQQLKPVKQTKTLKSVDATLAEYAPFAVDDNWLDEDIIFMMNRREQEARALDEQLDESEMEGDASGGKQTNEGENLAFMLQSDDPWTHYGDSRVADENPDRIKIDPNKAQEFLYKESDEDEAEAARIEAELLQRLAKIKTHSPSLERAHNNPKAKTFFERDPDATEGCDRMWVSAVDNLCFGNLKGTFRNYGVDFACNFGDFEDGCLEDELVTIEDMASFKARKVYEVTGLPCIASRTSFQIEPIPNFDVGKRAANPRVASGYRFNDIGLAVDHVCEALRPFSEPSRVTEFKTCLCFYDGYFEIYDYGVLECDLVFANSMRTFIPVAQAINDMMKTMELTFGLEHMPWLKSAENNKVAYASGGSKAGSASLKLRDRVLKEGRVLPNDIVDVSAFMDSMVDVDLMDECANELAERCMMMKPSKILTVATTGLVIALPMAKYMGVDVVYARKERNMVMADTYQAAYSSKTVGKNRELIVSTNHLDETDRILIVDDFLSSGASQEALLRIISESGATPVGVAVLLEKVYESGRQSLSGFDVPVESLCRIASVQSGVIQLVEEQGFEQITVSTTAKM